MSPANIEKVLELREDMLDYGIKFNPKVFDIKKDDCTPREFQLRAETRRSVYDQLISAGVEAKGAEAVIARMAGITLEKIGWDSLSSVTPDGVRNRIDSVYTKLGKERK